MQKNTRLRCLALALPVFLLTSPLSAQTTVAETGHVQTARQFIQTHFEDNGQFSVAKIESFKKRLELEKQSLMRDAYGTKLIEKIEVEFKDHEDAVKSAKKELDEKKSDYAEIYNDFLIVKINELLTCVQEKKAKSACEIPLNQFIAGYQGFFQPGGRSDKAISIGLIRNFMGFSVDPSIPKVEAANLLVEEENVVKTRTCLPTVQVGQLLSQAHIASLKSCGVDVSIYNPADRNLWQKPNMKEARDLHADRFPRENELVYFKGIKFSGRGSAKLEGEFTRNGKDVEVKIKMGKEVHSDTASSILGKMVGLYQDTSIPKMRMKVYFKKNMNIKAFRAQWKRKYSGLDKDLNSYIDSEGKDDNGSYVVLRDTQLSINDSDFIRMGGYNTEGWNLMNLREHRAQLLWYAFLGLQDTKAGNHALLFEKTKKEGLVPRYSFQDVGYSLSYQVQLNNLKNFKGVDRTVNAFSPTFLSAVGSRVDIHWSDTVSGTRFDTMTYADIKWMARQIAKLTSEDITYALTAAGYAPEEIDLYTHKLNSRRNEIVRYFQLANEFKQYAVPDLATYSPNDKVQNGEVVVTNFKGYNSYQLPRTTIVSTLLRALTTIAEFRFLNKDFKLQLDRDLVQKGERILGKPAIFQGLNVSPGVSFEVNRVVDVNPQFSLTGEKAQEFYVKDRLTIEIGATSDMFGKLKELFPSEVSVKGQVQVWKREYELIHFAQTWQQGYTSNFKLLQYLPNWKECVLNCLERNEVMKIADSYGFAVQAKVPVWATVGAQLSVGVAAMWGHARPSYFSRDIYNQLVIFESETDMIGWGIAVAFETKFKIPMIPVGLLEWMHTERKYKTKSSLYRFSLENNPTSVQQSMDLQMDKDLLSRYFEYGDDDVLVNAKKELELNAAAKIKEDRFRILFFIKTDYRRTGESDVTVKTQNGTRQFRRYATQNNKVKNMKLALIPAQDYASVRDNTVFVTVEKEVGADQEAVAFIELWKSQKNLNREGLIGFIGELNRLYSQPSAPFYKDKFIPEATDVPLYKKVASHTRIYLSGDRLITALKAMPEAQIEELFKTTAGKNLDPKRYANELKSFKNSVLDFVQADRNSADYLKKYAEFLNDLSLNELGLNLLQRILGEQKMFVIGEIFGVYTAYSDLQQDDQHIAGQRFTGMSYGTYEIPPLRKFLNKNVIGTQSVFIDAEAEVNNPMYFGGLPMDDIR